MNITTKGKVKLLDAHTDQIQSGLEVTVQYAVEELDSEEPPSARAIIQWAQAAFSEHNCISDSERSANGENTTEVTIRLVDKLEMSELNQAYRGKSSPTNVLSFPAQLAAELIEALEIDMLGDIVICHEVVIQEAKQQQKTVMDHYAHMVTHGVLHLCGYDHEDDVSASQMEALETKVLAASGINNPYS